MSANFPEFIPLSAPYLSGNERAYLQECVDTNWVSSVGPFVDRFEKELAERCEVDYCIAANSGTAALHVALLAAGVGPGDEVIVPTLTFIATANAVAYCGAVPVFLDVEPRHWQLDVNLLDDFLTNQCHVQDGSIINRATGRPVRAIVPMHLFGHPVEMDHLLALANWFELPVIEDAAEALGAKYKGRPCGSLGEVACLSFNGNKVITTGGGGAILTNRGDLAERARYLATTAKDDPVEYIHHEIGFNYRLTNIAAALGCAQLEQLDEAIAARRGHALAYQQQLGEIPGIEVFTAAADTFCTYWMSAIQVDAGKFGLDSRQLMQRLAEANIQSRPLWQPMHASRAHATSPRFLSGVADTLAADGLCLPCSRGLTPRQQSRVVETIRSAACRATKAA